MNKKRYADPGYYENKLSRVLTRLEVDEFNYNFDRHGSWIEFRYQGQLYRFEHSVEKARANGQKLDYGSDAFAQLVLALEDLSRIVERGIYQLGTWVSGMKFLPTPTAIPECFRILGFDRIPETRAEIETRYRGLAKQYHPDAGGSDSDFQTIKKAAEQAIKHLEKRTT